MQAMQPSSDEVQDLRRCVRDLVALSTLPAIWGNADPLRIGRSLAEVLLRILSVDFLYVRLHGRAGGPVLQAARTRRRAESVEQAHRIGEALEPWLQVDHVDTPPLIANPAGDGMVRLVVLPIGHGNDRGLLAAGCGRPDFPTDSERLLLGVAVNQAAELLQRKEAEEALQKQSEWLRVTLASIGDAVITTDIEGRVTSLNPVAELLTGWTQQDAQGMPLECVFHIVQEQSRQPAENPAQKSLQAGLVIGLANHTVLIARDGTERAIDDSAAPIKDGQGNILGVVLIFRDVTERRRMEQEIDRLNRDLQRRVTEFETLLNVIPIGIAVADDPTCRRIWSNPAMSRLLRLPAQANVSLSAPPEEHPGFKVFEEGEELPPGKLPLQQAIATGREVRGVKQDLLLHDGTWVNLLNYAVPLYDETGGIRGGLYVGVDITELERMQRALRQVELRWRTMAETLPNLLWTDQPDGQCDWLSSQWSKYTGIPEKELLGLRWLDMVLHPDDRQRTLECWQAACEDRGAYDLEYRIRRHDGQYRWFKTRGVPIRDENGKIIYWFGSCTDIEDQKRAEATLREADRRKDEFLAVLAHELRNPLAPIRNALQILKMPRLDKATAEGSRAMMERQVHHLIRLVDDLLDVSRVMRGKITLHRERVELASIIARAVETTQPLIQAQDHLLTISLPDESLPLEADPVRLAQVIGNLLTNAAKYTEPKGRIGLTVQREGNQAVVRIRDTGIGIAPDMLPRVFELFVQADHASAQSQGGLGIGLTLVRSLVALHHGTVHAHSDGLGKGSEFSVRLPLALKPKGANDCERGGPQQLATSPTGHRLLIVDDNKDAADSLAVLLRFQGHEVRVAHDGASALNVLKEYRPDMIILDLGMPGMDGYEVARRLRRLPGLEKVRLTALTGWGQQTDRRRTAEAGFDHHLVKPVELNDLADLLAELKPAQA